MSRTIQRTSDYWINQNRMARRRKLAQRRRLRIAARNYKTFGHVPRSWQARAA